MPDFRSSDGVEVVVEQADAALERYPNKFLWFAQREYFPHLWQILFHGAPQRFRHLVAGRRGGKTLSAAWEVLFYALHPHQFHLDMHGRESDEPLWIWVLAKDYKLGRPALLTFLKVMRQAGLTKGRDFEYNKTEKTITFPDGTLVEFKSADDPQSLRGAGLDILWIDESAFITSDEAWSVVRPGLSDKIGRVITTTTPKGKNWVWEVFFVKAKNDPDTFRVQYTSLDNPAFSREEWERELENYHPLLFKQEYMASFEAMAGVDLPSDWLHYYVFGEDSTLGDPDDIRLVPVDGKLGLRTYMAVDPALSLNADGDDFAMALIGIAEDNSQAYLIDTYKAKIPFPEQLERLEEWFLKYRPDYIGVEANAYQAALVQQAMRLPGLPNIVPVFTTGRKIATSHLTAKAQRILAMGPLFRTGRIRINRRHKDFIDQWVSYDSSLKNPRDDLLDAVEIALSLAGVLLPSTMAPAPREYQPAASIEEAAAKALQSLDSFNHRDKVPWDDDLGYDY